MKADVFNLQRLGPNHVRSSFQCGEERLNFYLQHQSGQDIRRNFSNVIVATRVDSPVIVGYYTLSTYSNKASSLPEEIRKTLPRYAQVPAVLLGRLAVDVSCHGEGLARLLLSDAVKRANLGDVAWAFFVVSAKHERAAEFYRHFGFKPFIGEPLNLWILRKTALNLLS